MYPQEAIAHNYKPDRFTIDSESFESTQLLSRKMFGKEVAELNIGQAYALIAILSELATDAERATGQVSTAEEREIIDSDLDGVEAFAGFLSRMDLDKVKSPLGELYIYVTATRGIKTVVENAKPSIEQVFHFKTQAE